MPAGRQAGIMTQGQSIIYSSGTGAARDSQFSLPDFSAHMSQPFSQAAPPDAPHGPSPRHCLVLILGSAQLTGAWRMPVVGCLLPGTCACWNQLVLHKLLAPVSGGNNLWALVKLQLPCLCPRRCNRRQQRESRGRVTGK